MIRDFPSGRAYVAGSSFRYFPILSGPLNSLSLSLRTCPSQQPYFYTTHRIFVTTARSPVGWSVPPSSTCTLQCIRSLYVLCAYSMYPPPSMLAGGETVWLAFDTPHRTDGRTTNGSARPTDIRSLARPYISNACAGEERERERERERRAHCRRRVVAIGSCLAITAAKIGRKIKIDCRDKFFKGVY